MAYAIGGPSGVIAGSDISIIEQLSVAVVGMGLNIEVAGATKLTGCCWQCPSSPSETRAGGLIGRTGDAYCLKHPFALAEVVDHQSLLRLCATAVPYSVTTETSETWLLGLLVPVDIAVEIGWQSVGGSH